MSVPFAPGRAQPQRLGLHELGVVVMPAVLFPDIEAGLIGAIERKREIAV